MLNRSCATLVEEFGMVVGRRVELAELVGDLEEIVGRIVWSVVSTVDRAGRPRSRVMHPVWDFGAMTGVVGTRRTPVKVAHLAGQSAVSCAYWSPEHDAAFLDCEASWVGEEELGWAWGELEKGYDPGGLWPGREGFAALRLRPYRVQVIRAEALGAGEEVPMWVG
ncbi:MAG TPA: pyridoxamine 5'-phosphate oxidase [Umezawaea sp.]|nr:pyridoxamine 5'-phosphate oxidase [Umezawaea sp.]